MKILILAVVSLALAASAQARTPTCPIPKTMEAAGRTFNVSCIHVDSQNRAMCIDFVGSSWNDLTARARCAVLPDSTFYRGACADMQVPLTETVGSCLEKLPIIGGLAEVHHVYRPASEQDFDEICEGFHGNRCVPDPYWR